MEEIIEKAVLPPPMRKMTKKVEALEFTDANIPGEIVVDEAGKLLKKWYAYEGKVGSLTEAYDYWIQFILPQQINARILILNKGNVSFENLILTPPMITTSKGQQTPLYPHQARESGYSYTADMYIDLVLNKGTPNEERKDHHFIGRVPVMLGSALDWLTTKSEQEKVNLGESVAEDFGGYFIIKGTEKIILIQEKLRPNRFFVFNSTSKGDVVVKITNNIFTGSTQITMAKGKKRGALKIHLGFMKRNKGPSKKLGNTMSVFQIYRMLGVARSDIFKNISLFLKPQYIKKAYVALQPTFVKLDKIADDIEYISAKMGLGKLSYEMRKNTIINDLKNELFPQIPIDNIPYKIHMLSMMIARLVEYLIGARPLDDRDNWGNKQLVTAGKSLELLFSSIWKSLIEKTQDEVEKKKLGGLNAVAAALSPSFITENFIESFTANNWGVAGSFLPKENITDILKRDSVLSVYSHLTKINTPMSRKGKAPKARLVQMSQLGYVCAAETPEGSLCVASDTPVLMADGEWKEIQFVKDGDIVMTVNPITLEFEPSEVTQPIRYHTAQSKKSLYRVKTINQNTVDCTEDHPFLVCRKVEGEFKRLWVEARELRAGDMMSICKIENKNSATETLGNKLKSLDYNKYKLNYRSWEEYGGRELIDDAEVCDFTTVNENHSFIAKSRTGMGGFVTHNCGLVKNSALTNYISIDRPEEIVLTHISHMISNAPTVEKGNVFMLNGVLRGWVNGPDLRDYCIHLRRGLKISKDTTVVLERDGTFNIYTDGCRPTRPLLIVDKDGKLVIEKKKLWDADFETLLREGCAEYIDAWEQENIMLAQTMDDVRARQSEINIAKRNLAEAQENLSRRVNIRGEPFFDEEDEKKAQLFVSQAEAVLKELLELPAYSHSEMDPTALMSIAVSVIPLGEVNPGPRLTYQSGMGKQALGIYHSNYANRFDTSSKVLAYPARPLFETQMYQILGLNELPAGDMVIVAVTTYGGYSQEDSIIMAKGAIERGLFRQIVFKTYKSVLNSSRNVSEEFGRPEIKKGEEGRYAAIGQDGLPKLGSFVKEGDCIIGKIRRLTSTGKVENASSFIEVKQEGVVDRILVSTNQDGKKVVKVKIRQVRQPDLGDKFAIRISQKGTIGMILPDEDMPFTASGVRPDIIINSHCLTADTPVTCYKGYSKRIADFTAEGGEGVWTWDLENKTFVKSTSMGMESKGVKKILKVFLEDGRVIKCTPDHKFLTVDHNGKQEWVEAKDLKGKRKMGGMTIGGDTVMAGLEFPVDNPEDDVGSTWKLETVEYTFDMTTPLNREKSLAFARILGYTLTDGCISAREDLTHGFAGTLNMGHDIDAIAVQEDIELITGKKPKIYFAKGTVNIRLPAPLAGSFGNLPGVQHGKRPGQAVTLPDFINDPNCPKSVIREFLGGLFGGDGVAPCIIEPKDKRFKGGSAPLLIQTCFLQTCQIQMAEHLKLKMENISTLLLKLGVRTARIDGPHNIYYNSTGYEPKDGIARVKINIALEPCTEFGTKVGFRYCIQKTCRLSAANAYWRYQEEIVRQHDWTVQRTNEIYESGVARQHTNKKSIRVALEMANKELKDREAIINEYYSLSNVTDVHNRRNEKGLSSDSLNRSLYDHMLDVKQFMTRMGVVDWFLWEGNKFKYIVKRESPQIPSFKLRVLDIKEAGEEETFDIGVHGNHNFLANGVVVHNCIPSRMTMSMLMEIVTGKLAAFTGERINATPFRRFNIEEFMRNLKDLGYSSSGKEKMFSGYTGKPLEAQILIGPCYYTALRHQVKDKIQMRARGGIRQLTHQPVGGRKRGGGQRIGEMERDAIISHGASTFLQERLCKVSDAYETVACSTCGNFAISNNLDNRYVCRTCNEKAEFGKVCIPFSQKLLMQLLAGAGFQVKYNFKK